MTVIYEDSLTAFGKNLKWDGKDVEGKQGRTIKLTTGNKNFMDKSDWDNHFSWFIHYLEKFTIYFNPLIKNIKYNQNSILE